MSHQEPAEKPEVTLLEHLEGELNLAKARRERALASWQAILGKLHPLSCRKMRVLYDYQNVSLAFEVDVEHKVHTLFRCWVHGDKLIFEDTKAGETKTLLPGDIGTVMAYIRGLIPAFLVKEGIYNLELLK